jgi:dihydrofolate synthase/folylpolyglutamate synthase
MTYDEAIAWWFGRIDYERRTPLAGDLKLDRMRELLHRLGDPHEEFRSIHVAGSKGKGSTCAMLESVLRQAGYRTGLFTSPHLSDVRERIQVQREIISHEDLVAVADIVRRTVDRMDQSPTFFEVATALGFLHFVRQQVDVAVVEVGLGGRFDSTNVLTPLVSVITSISLDHTAILGETVEQIAFEKAGIIKPGIPVVSGVTELGPRAVIEHIAAERGARLVQMLVDFSFCEWRVVSAECRVRMNAYSPLVTRHSIVLVSGRELEIDCPALLGEHQAANAAVAVAALEQLPREFAIPDAAVVEGLRSVQWPARFEPLNTVPMSILDCAHNVASAEALAKTLQELSLPGPRVLVFAASNDKDIAGMFRVLTPQFEKIYLTRTDSPRAFSPERLAAALPPRVAYACFNRPLDAWQTARSEIGPEGLIVIAGSVFLAGELRPHLLAAVSPPVEALRDRQGSRRS